MSAKAHAEFDPRMFGVRIAIRQSADVIRLWETNPVLLRQVNPEVAPTPSEGYSEWLGLREDEARALYDALADHFGHAGHDTRALRKDYDAERARVDRLIGNLIGGGK